MVAFISLLRRSALWSSGMFFRNPPNMNPTDTYSSQDRSPSSAGDAGAVRQTADKAKRAASRVAGQAKEKVAAMAGGRRDAAADRLTGYTDQLRASARTAEEQNDPNIAH